MADALRLLVVDDELLQIELVERALSRDGFIVRGVTELAEIATVVESLAPQIVLVDVNMPNVPNQYVVTLVREVAPSARLVLYSAWEESKLRQLARSLGADGFVSKSESVFELGRRLRAIDLA
jgi:two-component system OmpR family response regulator